MPASNQLMDSAAVVAEVTAGTWSWVTTNPGRASNLVWDWAAFLAYLVGSGSHGASNLCPDFASASAWVTPTPAPAAPTSPTVGSATSSALTVGWSWSGSNLTGFKIYRNTVNTFGSASVVHTGTSTGERSWADSGLSASTTYYYWVSAYGVGGESSPTTSANGTTLAAAPSGTPTGVTVTAASSGTVAHVSWTWGGGTVSGFEVYRDRNGSGSVLLFSTSGSGTTYNDSPLSDGDTVVYAIAAYTSGGDGPTSSPSSTYTVLYYPSAPTSLVSTGNTTTTEGLSWSYSGATVTGFKVYRDGSLVATLTGAGTTYTDTGLSSATSYSWVVTAYRTGTPDSANSNTLTDTTSSGTLTAPSGLTITDGSSIIAGTEHFNIDYSWTTGDATATTHSQYKKSSSGTWLTGPTDVAGVTSDRISLGTSISAGGDYDVRIRHEKTGWTPSAWVEVDATSIG